MDFLPMEIGVYTFVENTPHPTTGRILDPAQRLRDLIEEVEIADQVGLEIFGIGEHHRPDFLASAPIVMLGAAAERSKRIKLSTAVTVFELRRSGSRLRAIRHPPTCFPAGAPKSWPDAAHSSNVSAIRL
jgi:hypothetical protein